MTIREKINKKLKAIVIVSFAGMIVFIGGVVFHGKKEPPIISLIGFFLAFATMLYAHVGIKCPNCRGVLGYIAMYRGLDFRGPFSLSKKIKYCPFCGVNMESELNEKQV